MTGIVFDIQRFALHDGPGIRTTVFLKGCPLRCLWCHNPESQAYEPQLSFRRELCMDTEQRVDECESGAHQIVNGRHEIDFTVPASAHTCVTTCASGAFSIIGKAMTVDEVMDEVLRDEAYFKRSGGGLTLSGGEPLAQFQFALAILMAAKQRGLHTCLDTSGMASRRRIAAAADYVDLFLFDYKATDPDEHRRLTGARNDLILANLDYLYKRNSRIILRCPLIPGVNDSEHHLNGIAKLSTRYPRLEKIEILPYHNMGRDKAERVGMEAPLGHVPSTDEATITRWHDWFMNAGCDVEIPAFGS